MSHLSGLVFSACLLVNNQLCISSFVQEKEKNYAEDFGGAFLLWLRVLSDLNTCLVWWGVIRMSIKALLCIP